MNGPHAETQATPAGRVASYIRKWFYASWSHETFPPDFADLTDVVERPLRREMLIFAAEQVKRMPLSRERDAVLREIAVELGEMRTF